MLKKIKLIVFIICSNTLIGQTLNFKLLEDTTIYLEELTFNSPHEKQTFKDIYLEKSKDYFSLFYLSRKGVDFNKIEAEKLKLQVQTNLYKSKKKDEKSLIKWIYKDIHHQFFKKYELVNHFDNVFESGYYNCLSATAIYALVLDELGVPYQINILPNHVNLTAYPESHKIIIETTDPVKGYFIYDKKFKEQYVSNLLAYKVIEKKDIELKTTEEVFDIYYSTKDDVNLKELVGVQYYNDGLYLLEDGKNEEGIEQLEKSIALYPSTNTANILMSAYLNELNESDYTNEHHKEYLIRVARYKELKDDIIEGVITEVARVADHNVIANKDTTFFKSFYSTISQNFNENELVKKKLEIIYFGVMGEYYYKDVQYDIASNYFEKALQIGGDTLGLEELYVRAILLHVDGISDKEKVMSFLINSEKKYNKLIDNKLYMSYKTEVISLLMMRSFDRNKIKIGEDYRVELENILDNIDVKKNETNIGIAYAQAGAAYFRLGNRSKAKAMFVKGLTYCPDHFELENRLRMMNY